MNPTGCGPRSGSGVILPSACRASIRTSVQSPTKRAAAVDGSSLTDVHIVREQHISAIPSFFISLLRQTPQAKPPIVLPSSTKDHDGHVPADTVQPRVTG